MGKGKTIVLLLADLTTIAVDAMVNPANENLLPGSGLCGVMHKKGGVELTAACQELFRKHRARPVGSTIATTAGHLPARYVIHAVSPKWHEHPANPAAPLRETYRNILRCADQLQLETVSIPAISTGIHKYPKDFAARVALEEVSGGLERCHFVRNILLISSNYETAMVYSDVAFEVGITDVGLVDLMPDALD